MNIIDDIEYIEAKTLLTKNKHKERWFGADYNLNIYRGCSHGCIYCDSRSDCYRIENFDKVTVKKNSLHILEKEIKSKRLKGVISTGAMSDPYNPLEARLNLTRESLELIYKYGWGVDLTTKSDLIARDYDILGKISIFSPICIKMTVTAADDETARKIEPNVAVTSKRFEALKKLSDIGIFTGILLMPVLPFITDSMQNISDVIRLSYESGAKFVFFGGGVTLRQNQRTYYFKKLDEHFPGLKSKYIRIYGNKYFCNILNMKDMYSFFKAECKKYGLLYEMHDIIRAYKSNGIKGTLF